MNMILMIYQNLRLVIRVISLKVKTADFITIGDKEALRSEVVIKDEIYSY